MAPKFAILAPRGSAHFGGRAAYERWVERVLAIFEDPSAFTYSGLFRVEGTVAA